MKAKMHISTGQYSFLEVELEGTKEEIVAQYFEVGEHYREVEKDKILKDSNNQEW